MFPLPPSSTPLAGGDAGATRPPHPSASTVAGATPTADATNAPPPWQRVDAGWPVIIDSPSGLDGDAQRLVRRLLTQAAGLRLARRRKLEAARLWMWQPMPHLAEYVRQRRFYAPGLWRFPLADLWAMLHEEAALTLEVIITPPGVVGVEVWQELLELQCQRIGQVYAEVQRQLGAARAQAELRRILEGLV